MTILHSSRSRLPAPGLMQHIEGWLFPTRLSSQGVNEAEVFVEHGVTQDVLAVREPNTFCPALREELSDCSCKAMLRPPARHAHWQGAQPPCIRGPCLDQAVQDPGMARCANYAITSKLLATQLPHLLTKVVLGGRPLCITGCAFKRRAVPWGLKRACPLRAGFTKATWAYVHVGL